MIGDEAERCQSSGIYALVLWYLRLRTEIDDRNWSNSRTDYSDVDFTEFTLVELLFHSSGVDIDFSRCYRSFVPERTFGGSVLDR